MRIYHAEAVIMFDDHQIYEAVSPSFATAREASAYASAAGWIDALYLHRWGAVSIVSHHRGWTTFEYAVAPNGLSRPLHTRMSREEFDLPQAKIEARLSGVNRTTLETILVGL